MKRDKFLTTGDVAKYCEVTNTAVLNWIGAGKLPVFTTPGGHYRILKTNFRPFLEQHGMFIDEGFFSKGKDNNAPKLPRNLRLFIKTPRRCHIPDDIAYNFLLIGVNLHSKLL